MTSSKNIDADFLALPLQAVSDAAISTAKSLGASHVDIRVERVRTGVLSLRNTNPESQSDNTVSGIGVRVIVNGAWGFASAPEISVDSAKKLAQSAVALAQISKPLTTEKIALAPEPIYAGRKDFPVSRSQFETPSVILGQLDFCLHNVC